jgi:ABC-type lipoprotein export system ATPase subunit
MTVGRPDPAADINQPSAGALAADAALVRCSGVGRSYRAGGTVVAALADVTCAVGPGMQAALIGPSGSGKSTLLHLLAGLDEPSAGVISWPALGESHPYRVPGLVGLIFQAPSLLPPLNVEENVALPLQLAGRPERDARASARTALSALGLAGLARQLPEEISGGQAQRVATARVLAAAPPD